MAYWIRGRMAVFGLVTGIAPGRYGGIGREEHAGGFWFMVTTVFALGAWFVWLGVRSFLRAGERPPDS